MVSRQHRATTEDIISVIKSGKTIQTKNFSIRIKKQLLSPTKVAVVVSKKVAKHAVDRNTLKRRIRAILQCMNLVENVILVVYIKKNIVTVSREEYKKELQHALRQV